MTDVIDFETVRRERTLDAEGAITERLIAELAERAFVATGEDDIWAVKCLIGAVAAILGAPDAVIHALLAVCFDDLDTRPETVNERWRTIAWLRQCVADLEAVQLRASQAQE